MVIKKNTSNAAACSIDVPAIVKFFGGRVELVRELKAAGIVEITTGAIDKWQLRKQIPASRLMDLETLASRQRKEFALGSFIRRPVARPVRAQKTATKKKAA